MVIKWSFLFLEQSIPMNMLDGIQEDGQQDGHMKEPDQSGAP